MGDITKNISRHEVACNCGCGYDSLDFITANIVQSACDYFARKLGIDKVILDISSGCRCFAWNDHEDGSDNSQHLFARAIDHSIRGVTISELADFYLNQYPGLYGIGIYETFVHFDSRSGKPERWTVK